MKDIMETLGRVAFGVIVIVGLLVVGIALKFIWPVFIVLAIIFLPWVLLGYMASKKGGDKDKKDE